jgi:hypothetical protein
LFPFVRSTIVENGIINPDNLVALLGRSEHGITQPRPHDLRWVVYGLRPVPFYLGIGYAAAGLLLSVWVARDTRRHVALERSQHPRTESSLSFGDVFLRTSLTDRNLFAASQAGLVNNLNDGMSWGIFPLFFAAAGLGVERIGILKGVYPAVWGILQVVTGPLSDRWGRKGLIAAGMWVQALGLFAVAALDNFSWWLFGSMLLGLGTATASLTATATRYRRASAT